MQDEHNRGERVALGSVVLLGALLRLWRLGRESLWYDEAATLYLARFVDREGALFDSAWNTEPPLNPALAWLWNGIVSGLLGVTPLSPWHAFAVRLMPFALGVLGIAAAYWAARTLLRDGRTGLIAAFLFAISPFQIEYAQELRVYAFYVLAALCALAFMARALEGNRLRDWAGMVLPLALLPYAHFFSVWTIFAFNAAYVCAMPRYWRRLPAWFAANLVLMALIAAALVLAARMNATTHEIEYVWYVKPTLKTALITFKSFFAGFGPANWAYWPLFALALGLLARGLVGLCYSGRAAAAAIVLALVFVPILGNILYWNTRYFSFYQHRLFIVSGAVACIGVAAGLRALPPRARAAALAAFVFFTLPGLRDYYAGRLHPAEMHRIGMWDKVDFRAAAAHIESQWREGDFIAYASHFQTYPMQVYSARPQGRLGAADHDEAVYAKNLGNAAMSRNHNQMPQRMDRATRGVQRIWFLESYGTTFEYKPHTERVRAGLDRFWRRAGDWPFEGLGLTLYERPDPTRDPWPPNLLVVLIDTLRADRIGAQRNGQPVMPFLDRFAAGAAHFTRAYAPSSWTRPSMASLFTGLYPAVHGTIFSAGGDGPQAPAARPLSGDFTTLAEWLKAQGYVSFGYQTNLNCTPELGFGQGFDRYDFANGAPGEQVSAAALEVLPTLVPPYFSYAHYMDPHAPYAPPAADREPFGPMPALSPAMAQAVNVRFMEYLYETVDLTLGFKDAPTLPPLDDAAREAVRYLYDAECRYVDRCVETLVRGALAADPQTVVVVLSDHGEEFWEHGGLGHTTTLFEEQWRVPAIVRAPGLAPGPRTAPINTLGLGPTLAGLLRLPPDPAWQGSDWLGPAAPAVFGMTMGSVPANQLDLDAVLEGNWKYLEEQTCRRRMLFDLDADPAEALNRAEADPARAVAMRARLEAHRAANAARAPAAGQAPAVAVPPESQEELAALGYLGGGGTQRRCD